MNDEMIAASRFGDTRWSLVVQARGDGEPAQRAIAELCQLYWFPLYSWCRRHTASAMDAEDLVQGFFQQLLEKQLFAGAEAERGRLRSFLLTALQRYAKDEHRKAFSQRRGGGRVVSFDAAQAEEWYAEQVVPGESPEHLFDRQWALAILQNTLQKLEGDYVRRGKQQHFQLMKPYLSDEGNAAEYQMAADELGQSPDSFKVAVHRLRTRFRTLLRDEVAETQAEPAEIDDEIAYLAQLLSKG